MTKTKKENSKLETVLDLANQLLSQMGVTAKAEGTFDEEGNTVSLDIKTQDEAGLLIGKRGETLLSLQTVLSLMVKAKLGEWVRIVVNVADWREKEESYLKEMATSSVHRVKQTGEPQALYHLNSGQRRTIHMFLSEDPEVTTESVGEGEERYLLIKPKGK